MAAFTASFITLAIVGMLDAGYLLWRHYHKSNEPLICPLNNDCSKVTESEWSTLFGVRNEILGLLFYICILAGGIVSVFFPSNTTLFLLLRIATGLGLLFSLFLIWLQIYKIRNYCFYCMLSALITLLLFVNSFFL